jgi:hypothetical protein
LGKKKFCCSVKVAKVSVPLRLGVACVFTINNAPNCASGNAALSRDKIKKKVFSCNFYFLAISFGLCYKTFCGGIKCSNFHIDVTFEMRRALDRICLLIDTAKIVGQLFYKTETEGKRAR